MGRGRPRAERAADDAGLEVIGVVHSHTHSEPYPSPTDVAQAPDPGWHYVIVEGEVHVFDVKTGGFVPASLADNSGTGPYHPYVEHDGQVLLDEL